MALKFVCDGCTQDGPQEALTAVGRLEPAYYCADCLAAWTFFEAAQEAERERLVRDFEAWRAARLAELRPQLRRLPDE